MKTRGILFKPDLHQAILDGKKTVTRRLDLGWAKLRKGDRLYVKEKLMRQDADCRDSWAEYEYCRAWDQAWDLVDWYTHAEVKIRFGEFAAVYVDGELQDDLEAPAEDTPEEELELLALEACDVGYPYDPDNCEFDVLCEAEDEC